MPYPFKDQSCAKWYALYPRKKAPADVEKAWAKLGPDAQEQALKTVKGFADFWMRRLLDGDNIEYCPYPASYLNAGRHWDEPDPVAPPPPPSDFR